MKLVGIMDDTHAGSVTACVSPGCECDSPNCDSGCDSDNDSD